MSKFIISLGLLMLSPLAFAHGGDGMETLMVWFYTLVVIMHGALVLLLRNLLLYKYIGWVIISLLFSITALIVWWIALNIVIAYQSEINLLLAASIAGLLIYIAIVIWAIITPIKQYKQLKRPPQPETSAIEG